MRSKTCMGHYNRLIIVNKELSNEDARSRDFYAIVSLLIVQHFLFICQGNLEELRVLICDHFINLNFRLARIISRCINFGHTM